MANKAREVVAAENYDEKSETEKNVSGRVRTTPKDYLQQQQQQDPGLYSGHAVQVESPGLLPISPSASLRL